tara:strand:- start:54 stop:203 length:150 start_codon:yes stop_codon:yes gene_type:complete
MPFKSKDQRAFLYANYPKVAKNWTRKHGATIRKSSGKLLKTKPKSKRRN